MTESRNRHAACLFALILLACLTMGVLSGPAADASDSPEGAQTAPAWALEAAGLAGPVAGGPGISLEEAFESDTPYVAGEILVQKQADSAPQTVQVPEGVDPVAFARELQSRPGISAASPNFIARASSLPDDPGVGPWKAAPAGAWVKKQWNFLPCLSLCGRSDRAGESQSLGGIDVTGAWQNLKKAGRPGAEGVRIAVIDSGIAYRNYKRNFKKSPDLKRNHIGKGYDFVENDRRPLDRYGHGTHISSTIAQATNNGIGTTGMAYRARLLPVRVLNRNGFGTTKGITEGVRWAANHHVQVAVMSLNFPCGQKSKVLTDALQYAHSKGVVLVASAGNQGATFCPSLPATGPGVIAVGGSTSGACLAEYSFQSDAVTLVAPGGGEGHDDCPHASRDRPIFQLSMLFEDPTRFGVENRWIGTSMAAAHVAGAAAMVIASDVLGDVRGPRQVRDRLTATASTPEYAGTDPANGFGAGIIDVGRATDPNVTAGT